MLLLIVDLCPICFSLSFEKDQGTGKKTAFAILVNQSQDLSDNDKLKDIGHKSEVTYRLVSMRPNSSFHRGSLCNDSIICSSLKNTKNTL